MITLLDCLKHIKANGPIDKSSGICGNVMQVAEELKGFDNTRLVRELDKLLVEWPGNAAKSRFAKMSYPVEGKSSLYFARAKTMTLWRSRRRIALLDWLIEELEK